MAMGLLKFALKGNYKRYYNSLKDLSKKNGKNATIMFIDTAVSCFIYKSGLQDYLNYKFYDKNIKERKQYATIGYQAKFYKLAASNDYADFFKETYESEWNLLIDLNMHLIKGIMGFLKIDKPLVLSSSLAARGKKTQLIVSQCSEVGADVQLAGNGCKDYIEQDLFAEQGIKLVFQDFLHPVYPQGTDRFVPNLSVVDYLFCAGAKSW
jgi:hypothetical protein